MIVDPQTQSLIDIVGDDPEIVLRNEIGNVEIPKATDGRLGPSFLHHKLFGKAAGLFSRI
jgi:hypothetical protein